MSDTNVEQFSGQKLLPRTRDLNTEDEERRRDIAAGGSRLQSQQRDRQDDGKAYPKGICEVHPCDDAHRLGMVRKYLGGGDCVGPGEGRGGREAS